ncbi:MAG: hypothetical protein GC162_11325 [Planctomycetes bacterium]|nr:hypothetical protein [Planctomycetota bacterium]
MLTLVAAPVLAHDEAAAPAGAPAAAVADAANAVAPTPPAPPSFFARLWDFIGVFHPATVHFPVAMLTIAALFIVLRWKFRSISPDVAFYCLWIGVISAIVATAMGFSFAPQKGYGGITADMHAEVFWHRWLGVSVTILALITAIAATRARNTADPARVERWHVGVILCAMLVGLVGHQGGSLVYGDDLYTRAFEKLMNVAPKKNPIVVPIPIPVPTVNTGGVDFVTQIKPIIEAHCIKCHGPDKKKAHFQLHTRELAMTSGDTAPDNIKPKDSAHSNVIDLLSTADKDDVMPPSDEGGPLPKDQIDLIKKWIDDGAIWPDGVELTDKSKK